MKMLRTDVRINDPHHDELHNDERATINTLSTVWAAPPTGDATADTAELLGLLDASPALLLLHPGDYAISVTLPRRAGVSIRGAGMGVTRLLYSGSDSCIAWGNTAYAPTSGISKRWEGGVLSDLTIVGTAAGRAGVDLTAATRFVVERVKVSGFTRGAGFLTRGGSWIYTLRDCIAYACDVGFRAYMTSDLSDYQAVNAAIISGGEYAACRVGIQIGDVPPPDEMKLWRIGASLLLSGVAIEGNAEVGVHINEVDKATVRDCYFELNGNGGEGGVGHIRLGPHPNAPRTVSILDVWTVGASAGRATIRIDSGIYIYVERNNFGDGAGAATAYGIWLASDVNENYIFEANNLFNPGIISPPVYKEA